ncbi:hypothetical protein SAMN02910358_00475 [Lachnospiraceae bacterium XBB1006]|nr:hypothetical protein SAMN02910358_00475 [Lachnospiraceae bacterium XBB1006]
MRKRIVLLPLLCACALTVTGCTEKAPTTTHKNVTEETTEAENKPQTKTEKPKTEEKHVPDISSTALEREIAANAKQSLKKFDLNNSVFRFDNVMYQLPFSYARISKDWHFSLEDYGLKDDFKLEPGQRTTDNIRLTNPQTDNVIEVGLYNPYDVSISVNEAMVWAITFSIEDSVDKPKVRLPKKIRWNSSLVDITLAYSDPTVPFTHDLESKLYTYTYMKDYNHYLTLYISEEEGLVKFTLKRYN